MDDPAKRQAFANFLERLAAETSNRDDWFKYVVNHYSDERLEEFRRKCAGLAIEAGEPFPRTDEHRSQLRSWAEQLRSPLAPSHS